MLPTSKSLNIGDHGGIPKSRASRPEDEPLEDMIARWALRTGYVDRDAVSGSGSESPAHESARFSLQSSTGSTAERSKDSIRHPVLGRCVSESGVLISEAVGRLMSERDTPGDDDDRRDSLADYGSPVVSSSRDCTLNTSSTICGAPTPTSAAAEAQRPSPGNAAEFESVGVEISITREGLSQEHTSNGFAHPPRNLKGRPPAFPQPISPPRTDGHLLPGPGSASSPGSSDGEKAPKARPRLAEQEIPAWAKLALRSPLTSSTTPPDPFLASGLARRRSQKMRLERTMSADRGMMVSPGRNTFEDTAHGGRYVEAVVESLGKGTVDEQREVVAIVWGLTKKQAQNKATLVSVKGVQSLLAVIDGSSDPLTIEHAVTCILNVSNTEDIDEQVAEVDGYATLIRVLKRGNAVAKANTAAAIFVLAETPETKETFCRSNTIPLLLTLLTGSDLRGKKDAALALFQLTLCPLGVEEMASSGGVMALVGCLIENLEGMEDKLTGVFANLAKHAEGRNAIVEEGGVLALVELLEGGSRRAVEDTVGALMNLATTNSRAFDTILSEGCTPSLVRIAETGSSRAKTKAKALIDLLRMGASEEFVPHRPESSSPIDSPITPLSNNLKRSTRSEGEPSPLILQNGDRKIEVLW